MRQPARAAERRDVFVRVLRVALVAERQRAVQKKLTRLRTHRDKLLDRKFLQRRPRLAELAEIFPQNARIDRGDDRLHIARAVVLDFEFVEALVAAAETEDGKMRDVAHGGLGCVKGEAAITT